MSLEGAIADRVEQYEILELQAEKTTVDFEANKLKTCTVEETRGTAVRVIHGGRMGFSASTVDGGQDRLAANALESAAYGQVATFSFADQSPAASVRVFDPLVADLEISRLVRMGRETLDLILAAEPAARCSVTLERSIANATLRNQKGLDIKVRSTPLTLGVEITRVQGDDVLIIYDEIGSTVWTDRYLEPAQGLVERLLWAREAAQVRPGRMPVLFTPGGFQALALPLSQGLNGKDIHTGASPMAGKVGRKLFDHKLTVVDDGTLDGMLASAPYDDEGVPRRRSVLIERGVLLGYLHDLRTASLCGAVSTGSAQRGLFGPPQPAVSNFVVQPGQTPLKDMLNDVGEGILVDDVLGLGQGNTLSGAFSNPLALAYRIAGGEIVGRVKGLSLAGNIYEVLGCVEAVSRECRWVHSRYSAPYVLIPDMNVAGK